MKFIVGLFPASHGPARARWREIYGKDFRLASAATSKDGGVCLEIAVKEEEGAGKPDQDAVAEMAILSGTLFSYDDYRRVNPSVLLTAETLEEIRATRGARLSELAWGHYSGLFFDPADGSVTAVRDPTGGRPLYHADLPETGLHLFSNALPLLCRSIGGKLELDRAMIAISLAYMNGLPTRRTGFEAIRSLLPGECLNLSIATGERTQDLPWWRRAASGRGSQLPLDEALTGAVSAWTSASGRIALMLSGGVDSSGLLGMIAKVNGVDQVECLTHYHPGGVFDERYFSRLAAEHVGAHATEFDLSGYDYSLELDPSYLFCPRPHGFILYKELERTFSAQARSNGCDTFWLGFGGDMLFMHTPRPSVIIDALKANGPKAAAQQVVELALHEERPLWRVLFETLKFRSNASSLVDWAWTQRSQWRKDTLSGAELDIDGADLIDQCFAAIELPGYRARAYDAYYDMWISTEQRHLYTAGGIGYVLPYYSEPVIASALNHPTYKNLQYGMNRYSQREVLSEVMTPAITQRITKGGADDQVLRTLIRQADRIEEVLASGLLARTGFAEPEERRLDRGNIGSLNAWKNYSLVNMLATEVWLSSHRDVLEV